MSTTARRYWLKLLRRAGLKSFVSRSGLGLPFVCYPGDFAGEVPFYNRTHSTLEIMLMAAWCQNITNLVIFDVGANNGFIASQLAQLLEHKQLKIYAFEPVLTTFAQLLSTVDQLELQDHILPACLAVSDQSGISKLWFDPGNSLLAQVRRDGNARVGLSSSLAATLTLDQITSSLGISPALLKVDVEGFELCVLKGGRELLQRPDAPAVFFEWNPITLPEIHGDLPDLAEALPHHDLFYVDDFEGQRRPLGDPLPKLSSVSWPCNVVAVPRNTVCRERWQEVKRRFSGEKYHSGCA